MRKDNQQVADKILHLPIIRTLNLIIDTLKEKKKLKD